MRLAVAFSGVNGTKGQAFFSSPPVIVMWGTLAVNVRNIVEACYRLSLSCLEDPRNPPPLDSARALLFSDNGVHLNEAGSDQL